MLIKIQRTSFSGILNIFKAYLFSFSMKWSTQTYKVVAIISLGILLYVQYRLIYNTYELKDNQYNLEEKKLINEAYSQSIRNDKVFPGGQKIIDSLLYPYMASLEDLYFHNVTAFESRKKEITDRIFRTLQRLSNMDSVFNRIIKNNRLEKNIKYLLTIENMSVTFDGKNYITLFKKGEQLASFPNTEKGVVIGGSLARADKQNQVTFLSVTAPSAHSYLVSFSLYADKDNRILSILKAMFPTFLLSLFSIGFVVGIYYFTYRNWLKQKKLADMKSDFLNSITHEFNTPISTIMVANKSLQNENVIVNPANIFPLTEIIKRQAQRLQTLINQALDITSMNKATIEKEKYELHQLLKEIVEDYKLKITDNVTVTLLQSTSRIYISLNHFLFTTMLYNMFDNAIKYNTAENKEIRIFTETEGQFLIIHIQDNGIGMDETQTKQIFDKFYRGKNVLRAPGLGLGLFYVKQTLEAHGWQLKLTSEKGVGSKFCIFIPYQNQLI